MTTGGAFCTGGSVAHGDLEGPGGAEGLGTKDAFSAEPDFKIRPFPDARFADFTDGEAVREGPGDFDFPLASCSFAAADAAGVGSVT